MVDIKLLEDIEAHEGFRSKPYRDTVGVLTIGYGTNLDAGLSKAQGRALVVVKVEEIEAALAAVAGWILSLDPVRRRVVMEMAYNLGVPGLMKFVNTLAAVRAGNWTKASDGMLASKWATQVGYRAILLARRMRTGVD